MALKSVFGFPVNQGITKALLNHFINNSSSLKKNAFSKRRGRVVDDALLGHSSDRQTDRESKIELLANTKRSFSKKQGILSIVVSFTS